MTKITTYLFAFLTLFSLSSCSSGGDEPSPPTAPELVAQGWQSYVSKDYQSALDKFTQAIGLDGGFVDAYNGAGWAQAKLNRLSNSLTSFTTGHGKDSTNLEINAGMAIVLSAQHNYAQSALHATAVITAQPGWSFSHDATLSTADLHLLLAEDYFAMANYSSSLAEVKLLNSTFDADILTVAGKTLLAQEIERLRSLV